MAVGGALAVGQVVYVDIPGGIPHPAVVAYRLPSGACVLVSGTTSPQDWQPEPITMTPAMFRRAGLKPETRFYRHTTFLWYWKTPQPVRGPVHTVIGEALTDLRALATTILSSMGSLTQIQKLPAGAGLALADISELTALLATAR